MRTRTSLRRLQLIAVAATTVAIATACPAEPTGPSVPPVPGIAMNPQLSGGYFSMPWPNDIRRSDSGMNDWTSLPGINTDIFTEPLPPIPLLPEIVAKGQTTVNQFGRQTAVFFQANVELAAASLPAPDQTTSSGASVLLMDLATGELAPTVVVNQERADRFRPAHLLTVLPYPGHPLRSDARYAALVFDDVTSTSGDALTPSATLAQLDQPYDPSMPMTAAQHANLAGQYTDVKSAIANHTTHQLSDLVAFTVYRTQKTEREWDAIVAAMADVPTPTVNVTSTGACTPSSRDVGASMSIVKATISLPIWRNGSFPYLFEGGKVVVQPNGKAQQFGNRTAPVELMVPCSTMPAAGWPIVTHMDGTGGDEQIGTDIPIARRNGVLYGKISPLYGDGVGDAGAILSPLGFSSPRAQAEVLFYNLLNPDSIRSNPLQQAAEQLMFTKALESFSVPGAPFGQPGNVHGDASKVMITGHSQGAQTLPMIAAADPSIDGVISSSGSGGQYHTLAHSPRRLNTLSLVTNYADRLDELNPLIQVVQTVFEASDGANFANDTNFLNYTNYDDTCSVVETGLHFSRAQNLAIIPFTAPTSYGSTALDNDSVPSLPVQGNYGGTTRVSILLPGGHFNYMQNVDKSTAFQDGLFATGIATVPVGPYGYSSANCPGDRYDDPPRRFGI
ncbi:MAG: hypothetical protein V9G12_06365 [Microthrixaceae bacterium]